VFLKGDEAKMLAELAQAAISKGVKAPKEMVEALASVNPSDEAMAAADVLAASKSAVIFAAPALYRAAANITLIRAEAVSVPLEANAKGVVLMGLTSEGKKFREISSSASKALYVVGEVAVSKRPDTDFLVVQASHMTDLASQADVVLPAAASLESTGTIVDYLGRLKEVRKAVEPAGEAKTNADIFIAVAGAMGAALKMPKDSEIKKALKGKVKASFSPFRKDKDLDVEAEKFMEDSNKSVVNGSRLIWLKETEKAVPA
jgi:NADH dehydrogenase/NADH:ubiquinone oxidoreductase subunit G